MNPRHNKTAHDNVITKTDSHNMMSQDNTTTATRGGKRPGAGRKPKGATGTLRIGFRCSQDVWDILQQQPDKTAYIEAAIREKHRRE